jgi:hypothetical protein
VKAEAFTKLTYQRNAELLCDQLERREAAATMRAYAAEVEARAEQLDDPDAEDARELSAPPFLKLRSTRDPAVRGRKPKIATQ